MEGPAEEYNNRARLARSWRASKRRAGDALGGGRRRLGVLRPRRAGRRRTAAGAGGFTVAADARKERDARRSFRDPSVPPRREDVRAAVLRRARGAFPFALRVTMPDLAADPASAEPASRVPPADDGAGVSGDGRARVSERRGSTRTPWSTVSPSVRSVPSRCGARGGARKWSPRAGGTPKLTRKAVAVMDAALSVVAFVVSATWMGRARRRARARRAPPPPAALGGACWAKPSATLPLVAVCPVWSRVPRARLVVPVRRRPRCSRRRRRAPGRPPARRVLFARRRVVSRWSARSRAGARRRRSARRLVLLPSPDGPAAETSFRQPVQQRGGRLDRVPVALAVTWPARGSGRTSGARCRGRGRRGFLAAYFVRRVPRVRGDGRSAPRAVVRWASKGREPPTSPRGR